MVTKPNLLVTQKLDVLKYSQIQERKIYNKAFAGIPGGKNAFSLHCAFMVTKIKIKKFW